MKNFILCLVAMVALTLPSFGQTYTFSTSPAVPPTSNGWFVPDFDPSTGTLDSITISVDWYIDRTWQVENLNTNPGGMYADFTGTGSVGVRGVGMDLLADRMVNTHTITVGGPYDGITDFRGTSGATYHNVFHKFSTVTVTDPVALASFTGTGSTILTLGIRNYVVMDGHGVPSILGSSTLSNGDYSLTYNFH